MVKSTENGVSLPPFLLKCYEMVDDQSTDALISWGPAGDSFVISDVTEFVSELLPKYFKHKNFSSFIRQLNIYGFKKVDTDHWIFANDGFIKGEKHLLKNINRRKQSQVVVQQNQSQQKGKGKDVGECEEAKNNGLWKEVESLKANRNALSQELVNLRQHQQSSQSKMLILREQLKGMEKNQQQMLSFIVMAMQNPGFLVQLLQPIENNWRMAEGGKTVLKPVIDDNELAASDGTIVMYQPPMDQSPEPLSTQALDSDDLLEWELTSDEVKELLMSIDLTSGPGDEALPSPDSHWPIINPDMPGDDNDLEQFLLSSQSWENEEDGELPDSGGEKESTSSDKFEMETVASGAQLDVNQSMEILTERMGFLSSEQNLKHQNNF
ncbi:heat stress transcription factor A-8 [Diospyros lotus]|uniref:heat stress transcription factor A-8 n=1 Tax=Diospyros lotus TaxID=55363 RepID=UPI0022541200|nr:heat stress transcription factor A-8 [Diospyros lotus]